MTTHTSRTEDTTGNACQGRIAPWEPDPRWGVIPNTTPPRFVVRLSGPDEAAVLFAKVRADQRLTQQQIEAAHAERINTARATFDSGDSTKKDLAAAVHEADAERLAREDRLEQHFGGYTRDAILAQVTQAAQAANEASWRESIAAWQKTS